MSAELVADDAAPPPTPAAIMQLGLGFWASKTLLSAVELGVFGELASGPADAETLATRLGLHERSARDFLDALVAVGMLSRAGGEYANTPETDLFLDRGKPSYVGGMLEMANARLYPFWGRLPEALRTGQPQNEARTGGDVFGALYGDPEQLRGFLHAMTGLSMGASLAIARQLPFGGYETVVDVGAGEGGLLVQLALAHPHLRAIGFDLPPVREPFERYVGEFALGDRIAFVAGDFFEDALPAADVVVFGHVLHDWALDEKLLLLRRAYDALPDGGTVVVYESLIDDDRRANAFGLLMSLNMLIETPGGFDYTAADCRGWLEQVGFRESRAEPLPGADSVVVGIK